jgi:hypothetical protein
MHETGTGGTADVHNEGVVVEVAVEVIAERARAR